MRNIARNAMRSGYLGVMLGKLLTRARERGRESESTDAAAWCRDHAEDLDGFAESCDPALWQESRAFADDFAERARARLDALGLDLGGGGSYPLLYFATRRLRPQVVVETGVAAGFSSGAILAALQRNGGGRLHSSDFPYFRLERPERYVGYVVDEALKRDWDVRLRGDRANLPEIVAAVPRIDLFHYDSDKSYAGRAFALEAVGRRLHRGSVVIMDDIQDNLFFRNHVERLAVPYRVFAFEGKYLGLIGAANLQDPNAGDAGTG